MLRVQLDSLTKFDVSLCERALQIDPRNALALGLMAFNSLLPVLSAKPPDTHTQEAIQRADEFVTQSISADPNLYPLHALSADRYFIRSHTSVLMLLLPLIWLTIVGVLIVSRLSLTSIKRCWSVPFHAWFHETSTLWMTLLPSML